MQIRALQHKRKRKDLVAFGVCVKNASIMEACADKQGRLSASRPRDCPSGSDILGREGVHLATVRMATRPTTPRQQRDSHKPFCFQLRGRKILPSKFASDKFAVRELAPHATYIFPNGFQ